MPYPEISDELPRDGGWLSDYRRAVERLRGETVAELGRPPMPPEALSAIALAVASLPLVALMLPPIPLEPQVWQVGLALIAVWLGAFRIQSVRYTRFHDRWHRKVAALGTALAVPAAEEHTFPALSRPRHQRGRSGQTSGAAAAR